jgi:hypothetical protein
VDILVFIAMVTWTALMSVAISLNPSMVRFKPVQPGKSRRLTIMLALISAFALALILLGRPWSTMIETTLLLVTGAAAVYWSWKHRRKRSNGAPESA